MRLRTPYQALYLFSGILCGLSVLSGCSTSDKQGGTRQINHVVLFHLQDPADASALQKDCAAWLKPLPEVSYYACGPHVDVGRTNVTDDYALGLIVSFENQSEYDAYLKAPAHVMLVEKWKPEFSGLTIYDIGNGTLD